LVSIAGKLELKNNQYSMQSPVYETVDNNNLDGNKFIHTNRLVPIYSETRGISSKTIREKIYFLLNEYLIHGLAEIFPQEILKKYRLLDITAAYKLVHFPNSYDDLDKSKERLAFNELFIKELQALKIRTLWKEQKLACTVSFIQGKDIKTGLDKFIDGLQFDLTQSQKDAVDQIVQDFFAGKPMNRFLQGDVGSGKTIVAVIAAYFIYLSGYRTLLMAPTEILAGQHHKTFLQFFSDYGIKVGLHTSSNKIPVKDIHKYNIIIGTHALISKNNFYENVGLVVIDEQHKFGVKQRAFLREKGNKPHFLTMTATPIPRTVALTKYADLDVSTLYDKPVGRKKIKTYVVHEVKRNAAYEWISKQIKSYGVQAFIVCPFIEESEKETMKSVKAANKEYEYLKNKVFPDLKVALIHGKQKIQDKDFIMNGFKSGEYSILVSTSVVEVGIDVPNATIMVIEGAERYGLAQLHQLRGRVGRGRAESYCFLFTSNNQDNKRLKFFARTENGLDLAEYDMKIRGGGNIYGTQQHGTLESKYIDYYNINFINNVKAALSDFLSNDNVNKYSYFHEVVEHNLNEFIAMD
jgi:ATP-dependent DNA helicase RecG